MGETHHRHAGAGEGAAPGGGEVSQGCCLPTGSVVQGPPCSWGRNFWPSQPGRSRTKIWRSHFLGFVTLDKLLSLSSPAFPYFEILLPGCKGWGGAGDDSTG